MRAYILLLAVATALLASASANADPITPAQLASTGFLSAESAGKRLLRTADLPLADDGKDGDEEEDEERGFTRTLGDAKILRMIAKNKSPDAILTKMGVKPSFVTHDGQKVYSAFDPAYQRYVNLLKHFNDNY